MDKLLPEDKLLKSIHFTDQDYPSLPKFTLFLPCIFNSVMQQERKAINKKNNSREGRKERRKIVKRMLGLANTPKN